MTKEIERKFLVNNFPKELIKNAETKSIHQGYLFLEGDRELRVRRKGSHYFMTRKSGEGIIRDEFEAPISKEVYDMLWPLTDGRQVTKIRHSFVFDGKILELDTFEGKLEPLTILEVEFDTEKEANEYIPPNFVAREITFDNRYRNAELATTGKPE